RAAGRRAYAERGMAAATALGADAPLDLSILLRARATDERRSPARHGRVRCAIAGAAAELESRLPDRVLVRSRGVSRAFRRLAPQLALAAFLDAARSYDSGDLGTGLARQRVRLARQPHAHADRTRARRRARSCGRRGAARLEHGVCKVDPPPAGGVGRCFESACALKKASRSPNPTALRGITVRCSSLTSTWAHVDARRNVSSTSSATSTPRRSTSSATSSTAGR